MKNDENKMSKEQQKELKRLFDGMPKHLRVMIEDGLRQKHKEKAKEQRQKLEANMPQIMEKIEEMIHSPFVLIIETIGHGAVFSRSKSAQHTKIMIEDALEEIIRNWGS